MKIQLSSIVIQSKQQVSTEIDGETVMMSVELGKYYGLDETGSRIWQLMKESVPVTEILNRLLSEYEDKNNSCEQDLIDLLDELHKDGLIHVTD